MGGVMPIDEGPHILSFVLPLTVPPMWANSSDPVDLRVSGAGESSVSLPVELALKSRNSRFPVLGVFDFDDKNTPKGKWGCRDLHDLDDEVGNVTLGIVRKATLRSDYIALGGGKEGCEDGSPRPVP
jgi:hypothetical protein